MDTQLKPIRNSFMMTCALLVAILLLGTDRVNAGGVAAPTNPPGLTVKQRADQLVAMTKAGYHTALFSTTPKEKFSFASGTNTALASANQKSKFSFASKARVAADDPPCNSICQLVVIQYPDLTPIIYARPITLYGNSDITMVVDVVEINGVSTSGLITVKIPKDPKFTLDFSPIDGKIGGRDVKNSVWTFKGLVGGLYTLTTDQKIAAGDKLSFGLTGKLTPGGTTGFITATAIVLGAAIGEVQVTNNNDADKIEYFQQ